MKLKKAAAIALAFATTAALCVPATALAAASDTATFEDGTIESSTANTKDSVITGTITATKLSVSVPTKAAFTIDPTITATAVDTQLTNVPTNYAVTNNSAVPVYAYISKCAIAKGADMTGTPTLVTAASGLDTANAVMFAVKDADSKPVDFATVTDWLTAGDSLKYYPIKDSGKLAAKGPSDATGDAATMSFYGQTTTGWADGDSFTVTPTFTVATKDPSKTA